MVVELVGKWAEIQGHRNGNINNDFKKPKFINFLLLIKEVILNNLRDNKDIVIDGKNRKKSYKPTYHE